MKALARHITQNVRQLSKRHCSACERERRLIQKIHYRQLPSDILIYIHFDEAIQDINEIAVL